MRERHAVHERREEGERGGEDGDDGGGDEPPECARLGGGGADGVGLLGGVYRRLDERAARHGEVEGDAKQQERVEERGQEMVRIAEMVRQQGVDLGADQEAEAVLGGNHHELLLKMLCFKDGHGYHPLHAAARQQLLREEAQEDEEDFEPGAY